MGHRVTLIPGDGTGPEITEQARRCVDATGAGIDWDIQPAGEDCLKTEGTPLPDRTLRSIRRNRVALKGPITTPVGFAYRSVNVRLRKLFDLYQNVRPAKSYRGVRSRYQDLDLVIFRENTDDLYVGIEFEKGKKATKRLIDFLIRLNPEARHIRKDSGISIKPISHARSERIVRAAFEYAQRFRRKKVTAVHKANIMKFSDGVFLKAARKAAEDYPTIAFEDRIVDNMCMQLVQKPEMYDVLVTPNLYGDIISDLCAGLIGGLGVAPGANIGERYAIFEAVHGSAPKYRGMNKVNPTALILSAVLMLHHLGEHRAAALLEDSVAEVIAEGRHVTYDLKPASDDPTAVGTREMADAIIRSIERKR